MKHLKLPLAWLLAIVILLSCLSAAPLSVAKGAADVELPEGNSVNTATASQGERNELIVTFKKSVSDSKIEKTVEAEDAAVETISQIGAIKIAQVSAEDMTDTAQALAEHREVEAVQPNYRYTLLDAADPLLDPNEPLYQYQFENTRAKEAWALLEGRVSNPTVVTAIDSGMDLRHEDLQATQAQEIKSAKEIAHFTIGEKETIDDDDDEQDGHGTHVNGIIGATYQNGKGGSGIAAGYHNELVRLLPVSASTEGAYFLTVDIVNAIAYAVQHGAKVINMSFGGYVRDLVMNAAIQEAYYNHNVVFVAASGNEDTEDFSSPSDLKEVISVNAGNSKDEPTYYSNYGTEKDILAPGDDVMSTLPGDDYGILSGTSMASPMVAGIAALVLDANPNLTPAQVYNILCASARQPAGIETRFDKSTGYGVVDAKAAVEAALAASAGTAVEDLQLKDDEIVVGIGDSYGAEALVQPATALAAMHWEIADPTVATVDSTGMITGVEKGITTVTVTAGGKSSTRQVRVKTTIALEDITVKGMPKNNMMTSGEVVAPTLNAYPFNANYRDIYVKSDNPAVLTASDGVLFAKRPGTATITVESWDKAIVKTYTITVKNSAAEVVFTQKPAWVMLGEPAAFEAIAYDYAGDTQVFSNIQYTSSNKKVLTVHQSTGVVTPVAVGKAYVTAKDAFTGHFEAVQVEVVKAAYGYADYNIKQTAKTKDSITIKWEKIPVAQQYLIERKDSANGVWRKVTTVGKNTTTYRQTKLPAGRVYYYRVTAVNPKYHGTLKPSNAPAMRTVPNYKLKQSAKTKTTITLKWAKVPAATGYYIQYKASKSAKWKTIKYVGAKTFAFKHTKLKAGRTVYYRLIATYKVGTSVRQFDPGPAVTARTAK
ncbi:MAG: S8 family serine peptidase [Clostridia bacterium]|nr:S8 family serine peptidase [Clostridia bacterium]